VLILQLCFNVHIAS